MTTTWSITGIVEQGGIPVPARPDGTAAPNWTLEAVHAVERPRHPDLHGHRVALVIDRDTSDVWVLDSGGADDGAVPGPPTRLTVDRPLTAYWEDDGPRWSPDGSRLAYTNGGGVWLTNPGRPRRLCDGSSPRWLNDTTLVVELDRDERTVLVLVDTTDGWPRPLPDLPGDLGEVAVSPDRTRIAATHSPRDDLNASRIVIIEPATGKVTELAGPTAIHDRGPVWSPDGTALCFVSEASGWYGIERWEPASGTRTPVTVDDADYGDLTWSANGLAAVRTRHGISELVVVDPTTGTPTTVGTGGVWSAPCWTPTGGLVACHEAPSVPPRLVLVRAAPTGPAPSGQDRTGSPPITGGSRGPVEVVELSPPAPVVVSTAPHVEPEHVWYPGPRGDVPAFLYRPAGATAARPVPAIVHPHGGPTSHYGAEWDGVAQYFCDKGYAWLAPNFVGSTSYGRRHERANHGVWGVDDTAECLAAHDWLAGLDWVHPDRIGIFGASYGSYLALASVVDGDRFACAVAKYGDCDILTSWAQGDRVGRLDLERMMGHPSAEPDAYHRGSPIHRIEAVSAPILVAHGLRDERVHPAQSEELVAALRRIGATYEYATYPTEGHGFLGRDAFCDFYRRMERFCDWHLLPPPRHREPPEALANPG